MLFVVVIAILAVKLPDSKNSEWCVVKVHCSAFYVLAPEEPFFGLSVCKKLVLYLLYFIHYYLCTSVYRWCYKFFINIGHQL